MNGTVSVTSFCDRAWSVSSTVRACPWSEARRSWSVLFGSEKTGESIPSAGKGLAADNQCDSQQHTTSFMKGDIDDVPVGGEWLRIALQSQELILWSSVAVAQRTIREDCGTGGVHSVRHAVSSICQWSSCSSSAKSLASSDGPVKADTTCGGASWVSRSMQDATVPRCVVAETHTAGRRLVIMNLPGRLFRSYQWRGFRWWGSSSTRKEISRPKQATARTRWEKQKWSGGCSSPSSWSRRSVGGGTSIWTVATSQNSMIPWRASGLDGNGPAVTTSLPGETGQTVDPTRRGQGLYESRSIKEVADAVCGGYCPRRGSACRTNFLQGA